MTDTRKHCPRCEHTKPRADFGSNKANADGLSLYCRPCVNAYAAARRTPRPVTERPCRVCNAAFLPAHPNVHFCSDACRRVRQVDDKREKDRAAYYADWPRRRALCRAWRQANLETARRHRREAYRRDPAKEKAAHRAWVAANRDRARVIWRDCRRRNAAVDDAQADARLIASGFALVRYTYRGEAFYRAAGPGRAIGPNEAVLARYECLDGRWVAHAPSIVPPAFRTLIGRILRRERYGRARRYQEAA